MHTRALRLLRFPDLFGDDHAAESPRSDSDLLLLSEAVHPSLSIGLPLSQRLAACSLAPSATSIAKLFRNGLPNLHWEHFNHMCEIVS